ncbi:PelD GGDEF domain-containing protein [Pandoraea communis]|uniref:PelD GGDEF domain-containing protein n=1 Tax=Pandoraea communis TaxID=2508297 RepID=UPI0025A59940|nr:PelD GGDEF domain-containing protein [Pandoraea communis]MDM8357590.1 PelD GGDEF domain-containing protein [Pandoraea communis]
MKTATQQDATLGAKPNGVEQVRRSKRFGSVSTYGRLLAPAATRPVMVFEVITGMALAVAIAWLLRPGDPLLIGLGFPWMWLVALVMALRYGALLGVVAGLVLAAVWYGLYGRHGAPFPAMFFVGGFTMIVIGGHFCDIWGNRATRARGINTYLNDRLVAITNNHYLLRVSHERLERDLLTKPSTMRDAITRLRELTLSSDPAATNDPLPNAQAMLEFAALTCQMEVASIFPVRNARLDATAVAHVGETFTAVPSDPLVQACLRDGTLSHVRDDTSVGEESAYIVCAPLTDAQGNINGMLIVRSMPFLALNHDNLQLLLVLLAYYADGLTQQAPVASVRDKVPAAPYDFALELGRLARIKRESGIQSSLVALVFPRGASGDSLFEQTVRSRRALDTLWVQSTPHQQIAIALMPITDESGIDGYLIRIENALRQQYGLDFQAGHVAVHSASVDELAPGAGLSKLLERCRDHA